MEGMKLSSNPFKSGPFRVNSDASRTIDLVHGDKTYNADVRYNKDGTYTINSSTHASGALLKNVDGELELSWKVGDSQNEQRGRLLLVPHDNLQTTFSFFDHSTGERIEWTSPEDSFVQEIGGAGDAAAGGTVAPMTGTVDQVLVKEGDHVKAGQNLIIMIAMKMEHTIKAPNDGVISGVLYEVGQTAEKGAPLVKFAE